MVLFFMVIWIFGYFFGVSCYYWGENGGIFFIGCYLLFDGEGNLRVIK